MSAADNFVMMKWIGAEQPPAEAEVYTVVIWHIDALGLYTKTVDSLEQAKQVIAERLSMGNSHADGDTEVLVFRGRNIPVGVQFHKVDVEFLE